MKTLKFKWSAQTEDHTIGIPVEFNSLTELKPFWSEPIPFLSYIEGKLVTYI